MSYNLSGAAIVAAALLLSGCQSSGSSSGATAALEGSTPSPFMSIGGQVFRKVWFAAPSVAGGWRCEVADVGLQRQEFLPPDHIALLVDSKNPVSCTNSKGEVLKAEFGPEGKGKGAFNPLRMRYVDVSLMPEAGGGTAKSYNFQPPAGYKGLKTGREILAGK